MKETEFHPKDETNKIEQQQIAKEELFRVEKLQPGQTMFEVNLKERTCCPAKYEETLTITHETIRGPQGNLIQLEQHGRKLIIKEGCLYISALNEKNARRKLLQRTFKYAQKNTPSGQQDIRKGR